MAPSITLLTLAGLALAVYALVVEANAANPDFKALCDLTIPVLDLDASCSKTLSSPEGHMLSFFNVVSVDSPIYLNPPNALLGVIYYLCVLLLPSRSPLVKFITTISLLTTIFLFSVLYKKKEVCLLCLSNHVVNLSLFYRIMIASPSRKTKSS